MSVFCAVFGMEMRFKTSFERGSKNRKITECCENAGKAGVLTGHRWQRQILAKKELGR